MATRWLFTSYSGRSRLSRFQLLRLDHRRGGWRGSTPRRGVEWRDVCRRIDAHPFDLLPLALPRRRARGGRSEARVIHTQLGGVVRARGQIPRPLPSPRWLLHPWLGVECASHVHHIGLLPAIDLHLESVLPAPPLPPLHLLPNPQPQPQPHHLLTTRLVVTHLLSHRVPPVDLPLLQSSHAIDNR